MSMVRWGDAKDPAEYRRLQLIEDAYDPFTVRNLERLGVGPGHRCLEIGAGAGSIARWMAERAGRNNVVASDLSTTFLAPLEELGVLVMRLDVTVDEPPPGGYDFIHARAVLEHVRQRDEAIKRMAAWLKPGGWLLVESTVMSPEFSRYPVVQRYVRATRAVLASAVGTDFDWGSLMPSPLIDAGLVEASSAGFVFPFHGDSPTGELARRSLKLLAEPAIAAGLLTSDDVNDLHALYSDPSYVDYCMTLIGAWGQRVESNANSSDHANRLLSSKLSQATATTMDQAIEARRIDGVHLAALVLSGRRPVLFSVRTWARGVLANETPEVADLVLLVVHELVKNAYVHTKSPRHVTLTRRPDIKTIRVEVEDGDQRIAPTATALRETGMGLGLRIVARASRCTGVSATDRGKIVWAEIYRSHDRTSCRLV